MRAKKYINDFNLVPIIEKLIQSDLL